MVRDAKDIPNSVHLKIATRFGEGKSRVVRKQLPADFPYPQEKLDRLCDELDAVLEEMLPSWKKYLPVGRTHFRKKAIFEGVHPKIKEFLEREGNPEPVTIKAYRTTMLGLRNNHNGNHNGYNRGAAVERHYNYSLVLEDTRPRVPITVVQQQLVLAPGTQIQMVNGQPTVVATNGQNVPVQMQ